MKKALLKSVAQAYVTAQVQAIVLYHQLVLRRTVTYGEIAKALSLEAWWGQLAQALEDITRDDHQNGRPLSSSLVINQGGLPGHGYFGLVARLGCIPPQPTPPKFRGPYPANPVEDVFWRSELQKMGIQP
jgi:hypothetical protein